MTAEERAKKLLEKLTGISYEALNRFDEKVTERNLGVLMDALRDQIEECRQIATGEYYAIRDCLKEASRQNDVRGFERHTYAIAVAERIEGKIHALSGIPDDDGPDDRFDIGGFECNGKQED